MLQGVIKAKEKETGTLPGWAKAHVTVSGCLKLTV